MEPVQSTFWGFKKYLTIILAAVFALVFWTWLSSPMTVTVTGTGEASVPATNVTISFSVNAVDSSPQTAISNANAKAVLIREFLKVKGISESDIAEGSVTAVPASLVTAGASGYQATITMAVKTTQVADVSTLVSDLYANGAQVVSQPVLSVENQDELEDQAFDAAMKDAKSQAASLGTKNLKFIRKVIAVSSATSSTTSTATTKDEAENGVFKIVKAVSVSYKMW